MTRGSACALVIAVYYVTGLFMAIFHTPVWPGPLTLNVLMLAMVFAIGLVGISLALLTDRANSAFDWWKNATGAVKFAACLSILNLLLGIQSLPFTMRVELGTVVHENCNLVGQEVPIEKKLECAGDLYSDNLETVLGDDQSTFTIPSLFLLFWSIVFGGLTVTWSRTRP